MAVVVAVAAVPHGRGGSPCRGVVVWSARRRRGGGSIGGWWEGGGIGLARAGGFAGLGGGQFARGWVVAVWLWARPDGGGNTPGLASCLPLLAARGRVVEWGEMGKERVPPPVIPSRPSLDLSEPRNGRKQRLRSGGASSPLIWPITVFKY